MSLDKKVSVKMLLDKKGYRLYKPSITFHDTIKVKKVKVLGFTVSYKLGKASTSQWTSHITFLGRPVPECANKITENRLYLKKQ